MLNQFLNAFTGSLTTTSYAYPDINGVNIPPKATFKNFFKNLVSSLGANSQFGGIPGQSVSYGGVSQAGFGPGLGVQQGTYGNFQSSNLQQRGKTKSRALSPGSVINNFAGPFQPPQAPGLYGQNQLAGAPLQGFAGQAGINGSFGPSQFGNPTQVPFGTGFPQTNAPGGILPTLIMPIIGLFTILGSIFNLKRFVNRFKPVEVDKTVAYDEYKNYLDELYSTRGSFDVEPEFELQTENIQETFDLSKMQDF